MRITPIKQNNLFFKTNTVNKSAKTDKNTKQTEYRENFSTPVIGFAGSRKDLNDIRAMYSIEHDFTPEAEKVYNLGKEIAKKTGSNKLDTTHLYLASLISADKYINDLDTGAIKCDNNTRQYIGLSLQELISPECKALSDDKSRAKVKKVIRKHIKTTKNELLPKNQGRFMPSLSSPSPAKETIEDLRETYNLLIQKTNAVSFLDSFFIASAANSQNLKLSKEVQDLVLDLQKALMIDNSSKKENFHLDFYNDKADLIWKNINYGNNAMFLYDSCDENPQNIWYQALLIL